MPRIWNLRQVPLGLGKFSSGLDGVKLQHHEGIKSRRDVYMSHYLFCYFCYFFFFCTKIQGYRLYTASFACPCGLPFMCIFCWHLTAKHAPYSPCKARWASEDPSVTAPKKRCWRNLSCKKLGKSKRAMHFHNWGMSKWEALFHFFYPLHAYLFIQRGPLDPSVGGTNNYTDYNT